MPTPWTLRDAGPRDVPAMTAIYNDAIARTVASFWTSPRPESDLGDQLAAAGDLYPWLVADIDQHTVGWVQSKPWNPRDAYAATCELTVYIAESARGSGVGSALYAEIIERLRARGFRSVIGGVTLPNEPSERLHLRHGFRKVAHFEAVGEKFGRVLDVGYYQLRLRP